MANAKFGKAGENAVTASGKKSSARIYNPITAEGVDDEGVAIKIKEAVTKFVKYSKLEKSAKIQKESFASVLRKHIGDFRDQLAFKGDHQKTFRMLGFIQRAYQYAVDVTQVDKFTPVSEADDVKKLKELLGKVNTELMLEKQVTLSIKEDVMKSPTLRKELSARLAAAFGNDLKTYFEKKEVWVTREGFDKMQYRLDKDVRTEVLGILTPTKDSIKDVSNRVED